MYIDAPMNTYRNHTGATDHIFFRDAKTPSIFHKFLLPPKMHDSELQQNLLSIIHEMENKRIENCNEIYNICYRGPCDIHKYFDLARDDEIERSIVIIPTCDDFITQAENTAGFVK